MKTMPTRNAVRASRYSVKATSLNYHDVFTTKGMPGIKVPLPIVIGLDISGEIAEIGAGVNGWSVGDQILVNPLDPITPEKGLMGEMLDGGTAELCVVDATRLIKIPDGCSYEQAAALPAAYGTAHRMMITNGRMKGGEKVLILGASGGVGSCCVLLAKAMGCEVVAAGSSPEKLDALKAWGADHVIGYEDFEKTIYGIYGKPHRRKFEGGVDVVINFTGGDTWVPSLKATARWQDSDLRCNRRFRSEGRSALYMDVRTSGSGIQFLGDRRSRNPDGDDSGREA